MPFGKILNWLNIAIIAYMGVFALVSFFSLPARIPLHFDFNGNVDRMGSRYFIFLGFGAGILIYALHRFLSGSNDSQLLHVPENMRNNRKISRLFVRVVSFYALLLLADLVTEIVLIAHGYYGKLSMASNIIIAMLFFSVVAYFIFARKKLNQVK